MAVPGPNDRGAALGRNRIRTALSADPGTVGVSQDVSPFSGRSAWAVVRARLRLGGTPRGWSADVGVVHANLQLEGGLTLESATAGHLAAVPVEGSEERPVRALLRELLGVDRLVPGTPPRGESTIVFYLRDAELGRVAPATGTYRGRFRVQLPSHAIEAARPLERGATHHSGSYRVVLSGMEHGLASASILVRESDATSGFDRSPRSDLNFYLRNRRTRDAIAGHSYDFESRPLLMLLGLSAASNSSGFRARRLMVQFRGDSADGSDSVALDQQWLGDADLVLVRATRQGSVERTLTIPDFPLRVSNTTTGVRAVSPASRSASVLRR